MKIVTVIPLQEIVRRPGQVIDLETASPTQRQQMGQRARILYEKQYSFVKQSQKLQLAYKALIK